MSSNSAAFDEVAAAGSPLSMQQAPNSNDPVVAPGAVRSSSIDQSITATSTLNSNTSHSSVYHHANKYEGSSTHNNPIYTGPVYNIGTATFADHSRPSLSPPLPGGPHAPWASHPSLLASPYPTPPSGPMASNYSSSNDAIPSPSRSQTPMTGKWIYVPESENSSRSSSEMGSAANREPEALSVVMIPPDVEETARDLERQLKAAFEGFLAKEHQALDPALSPRRGRDS